ncbi:MAG TPA: helical backbone metal receptor [Kofleriaceae bacterium]
MRALVMCLALVAACGNNSAPSGSTAGSAAGSQPSAPVEQRVVSLTPSATEVMAALGATKLLVGVDDYSTYPPEVTSLPKVGSFMQPNLEAIVRLKPTLVIVDDVHGATAGALNDAGVKTVECAMHALPDVKSALVAVGAKIGKSAEADKVSHDIDAAIDAASAKRPAKRLRVLAIIDREAGGLGGLVAAGPGSWIDELLAIVGAENVLASTDCGFAQTPYLTRVHPTIIWAKLEALAEGARIAGGRLFG